MLLKVALEPVDQPGPGFYSRLFLVEKGTGNWRPVIDLSAMNDIFTLTKFQMETVASVLGSVTKPLFESRMNWVYDPAPPAPRRATVDLLIPL